MSDLGLLPKHRLDRPLSEAEKTAGAGNQKALGLLGIFGLIAVFLISNMIIYTDIFEKPIADTHVVLLLLGPYVLKSSVQAMAKAKV